jgi:toxin HigB-1
MGGLRTVMIKTFRHKGLMKMYETGSHQGVNPDHAKRLRAILARLDASASHDDMNLPGLGLHSLRGKYAGFWAVSVSGNWRVVFRFENGNAMDEDYVDYH